jgi:hypothetical protein
VCILPHTEAGVIVIVIVIVIVVVVVVVIIIIRFGRLSLNYVAVIPICSHTDP